MAFLKPFFSRLAAFLGQLKQLPVTALMATVISICALCVSLYQAYLSREQQLASVWPYLSIGGYGAANDLKHSWGIRIVNNGLGPAIIDSIEVRLSEQPLPFQRFVDSLYARTVRLDSLKSLNYTMNDIDPGEVLPAGATHEWLAFELGFSGKPTGPPTMQRFLPQIEILVRYHSLYGQRWESCFNCGGATNRVRRLD